MTISVSNTGSESQDTCTAVREFYNPGKQAVDPTKIPLIIVHGWKYDKYTCAQFAQWNPATDYWPDLLRLISDPSNGLTRYQVWVVRYPTNRPVQEGVAYLANQIATKFGKRPVVIVAHSMGGMVGAAYAATNQGKADVAQLITLGTPYAGSPLAHAIIGDIATNGLADCGKRTEWALNALRHTWWKIVPTPGVYDLRIESDIVQKTLLPNMPFVKPVLSAYWGDVTTGFNRTDPFTDVLDHATLIVGRCALQAAGTDPGDGIVPLSSARAPVGIGAADAAAFYGYDHLDIVTTQFGSVALNQVVHRLAALQSQIAAIATQVSVVSGNAQIGVEGSLLPASIRLRALDAQGIGVPNVSLHVAVASGGGQVDGVNAEDVETDGGGYVMVGWRLGSQTGQQTLSVTSSQINTSSLMVSATAIASSSSSITPTLYSSAPGVQNCALDAAGHAYCWGAEVGGTYNTPTALAGGYVFTTLVSGGHTCGLTSGGMAYCWGNGGEGQLGNGATANSASPVAVGGGHTFVSLAASGANTCALTSDGTAYCWGFDRFGQTGNGIQEEIDSVPTPVSTSLKFVKLALGEDHTCGLTANGVVYCWGADQLGQLGTSSAPNSCVIPGGTYPCALAPDSVQTSQRFTTIAAGGSHTCALTAGGAIYCWGSNLGGQVGQSFGLGDGTTNNSPTPVPVASGMSFSSITAGGGFTCALTASGSAYCWGNNYNGSLGDGSGVPQLSPAAVSGGYAFGTLVSGSDISCGRLASDGTLYCWGDNTFGELGNGSTSGYSAVPVLVSVP